MFSNKFQGSFSCFVYFEQNRVVSYDVYLLMKTIMMMMMTFRLRTNGITCRFAETGDRPKNKSKTDDKSGQNWTPLFGKIIASEKMTYRKQKVKINVQQ
jgi:hypothetical protein